MFFSDQAVSLARKLITTSDISRDDTTGRPLGPSGHSGEWRLPHFLLFALLGSAALLFLLCGSTITNNAISLSAARSGECINNTCVCASQYSGKSDFFDMTGSDCVTHDLARLALAFWPLVILIIAYGLTILAVVVQLYRLVTIAPLSLVDMFVQKGKYSKNYTLAKRFCLWALIEGLSVVGYLSPLIFWNRYQHSTGWAVAALCIFLVSGFFKATPVLFFQVRQVLSLSQMSTKKLTLGALNGSTLKLQIANTIIASILGVTFTIANALVPDPMLQISTTSLESSTRPWLMLCFFCADMWRVVLAACVFVSIASVTIGIRYITLLIGYIEENLRAMPNGKSDSLNTVVVKLKQMRLATAIPYGVAVAYPAVTIALPTIMTYFLPVLFSTIAASNISTSLASFSPSKLGGKDSGKTASRTASGVATSSATTSNQIV